MKICLVNPPVLSVLEPWYDTPDFGRTGLAYLAGYLRQYPEYEVEIIDSKFERLDFEDTIDRISLSKPDIVGLTAFTNEVKPAAYLAALIKKKFPEIVVIIGGVHVTAIPEETMVEFPYFDIGVIGEGEITLYELCEAIRFGQNLADINGIIYREQGQLIKTRTRSRIADQDSIPFPAWDLLPRADTYFVQTIRGCPYNCSFCMNPNGKIARKRSVQNVIQELEYIIRTFRPKRISFGDELFSVDIPRTHELLDAMIIHEIGQKVLWDVQTHVNYVDEELFRKFKLANVDRVELGIETGDETALRKMGKGTSLKNIRSACDAAKVHDVKIGTFLLFGQPNESPQSLQKTIDIAVKINPELPMFGIMTPYPGTEVAKMAAKGENGYQLITTDWDEYNKQIGGAMKFANLTRRQIEWYQIKAYLSVYIYNRRWGDLVRFIWEYRHGAFQVLKKIFSKKNTLSDLMDKPQDYDQILSGGQGISLEKFVSSRENWQKIQKEEMKELKK